MSPTPLTSQFIAPAATTEMVSPAEPAPAARARTRPQERKAGAVAAVLEGCCDCTLCTRECAFLERQGTPGRLCLQHSFAPAWSRAVFACTLCGLCETACPKKLPLTEALLEIRRDLQRLDRRGPAAASVERRHGRICAYERLGTSALLRLHLLPKGGDTVFFPGCTLAASRAEVTRRTYEHLRGIIPNLGIVLDCCSKPSHDLGLDDRFSLSFARLAARLRQRGVKTILTACPSCLVTLRKYLPECETRSVYEVLAEHPPALAEKRQETAVVHDACASRHLPAVHNAVRSLVGELGIEAREMAHSRERALCCGEGAAAAHIAPELSGRWRDLRRHESGGAPVVTYCAGCASTFAGSMPTSHLLDLLFDHDRPGAGKQRRSRFPLTAIRRLWLKVRLLLGTFTFS